MKPAAKRAVESTEEFKLRIAAIVGDKPEHILAPRRPNPLLVRPKKRQKAKRRTVP